MTADHWIYEFATLAEKTDRFLDASDHVELLAAGLFSEAGSVIAELKKARREGEAYPAYRKRMVEEIGDFLWYFARLTAIVAPGLFDELREPDTSPANGPALGAHLRFGVSVAEVIASVNSATRSDVQQRLGRTWDLLNVIGKHAEVTLREAADANTAKTKSRWPDVRRYAPLFDDAFPIEEQLPRQLRIEFLERSRGVQRAVVLRCNDINFGDRISDNIADPDGYRFHDIFHFANAVHLGWSPVLRALLRTKRKSKPEVDEAQDGARAGIVEEAASAITFSRAKRLKFFEGIESVDFDLLKTIEEFVQGFEVAAIPLWQWEAAILDGYRVFRSLRDAGGGYVTLDLVDHRLTFMSHNANDESAQRLTTSG